ncbi:Endocytosis and vacuole integrity protein [Tieghemiomyces parasiticus]|uniref:Endocytosis and vacuole integrity protein n=1 Tax=Tieghemiomyces parasiticus TaxID=78921 RepID=A0A9W8E2L3_9FUNG|nr:Endocytosis and vacuole integrity protein [Tieghemiomyces parasiticus]
MSGFASTLMTELASLSSEARRKHPEIKEASEKVILRIRSCRSQASADLVTELGRYDDVVQPFVLACTTKQVKLVTIAMGCLQRLTNSRAVPPGTVSTILTRLTDVVPLGVDIQLKILQLLLPLLANYPSVHGPVLAQAFRLCFKLQESKVAVVNNTAAATLRQLVIMTFDKVSKEDGERKAVSPAMISSVPSAPNTTTESTAEPAAEANTPSDPSPAPEEAEAESEPTESLSESARDALDVFRDLCLLTGGSPSQFVEIPGLTRTFGLELMESVLAYHAAVFHAHVPFARLLREHMCPVLLKLFSECTDFPTYMRLLRLFFLSVKRLRTLIPVECEIYISMLIRLLEPDHPAWQRVLALEAFRGMAGDAALLHFLYDEYDRRTRAKAVFQDLIAAVGRLAAEKPASIGYATGSAAAGPRIRAGHAPGADVASGLASSSSSITLAHPGSGAHESADHTADTSDPSVLSRATALMRIQCLDQLDKVDPPPIPETYLFYLSLECLAAVVESLASLTLPTLTHRIPLEETGGPSTSVDPEKADRTPAVAGDCSPRGALTVEILDRRIDPTQDPRLAAPRGMTEASWPAVLAAFSFYLTTRLDDDLFSRLLNALRALTNLCGALGLDTPRDALLANLCKHCLPNPPDRPVPRREPSVAAGAASPGGSPLVPPESHASPGKNRLPAALRDAAKQTGDALNTLVSTLTGHGSASRPVAVQLSERNRRCLRALVSVAEFLGDILDHAWYPVLLTLQQADELVPADMFPGTTKRASVAEHSRRNSLRTLDRGPAPQSGSRASSLLNGGAPDPEAFTALCRPLFDRAVHLAPSSFLAFVRALVALSCDLAHVTPPTCDVSAVRRMAETNTGLNRRPVPQDRPSFALVYLEYITVHNLVTLVRADVADSGTAVEGDAESTVTPFHLITTHLVDVARGPAVPATIAQQACGIVSELAEVALTAADWILTDESHGKEPAPYPSAAAVQTRVLTPLAQIVLRSGAPSNALHVRTDSGALAPGESRVLGRSGQTTEAARTALETLNRILHSTGQSIVPAAWAVIFDTIGAGYGSAAVARHVVDGANGDEAESIDIFARSLNADDDHSHLTEPSEALVRYTFPCLQLVCTDFLSALPPACLARCVHLLGCYGRQRGEVNVALTAIGLFWSVADYLPKDQDLPTALRDRLWLLLTHRLAGLSVDPRAEVRNGACRTLYRALDLHGNALGRSVWSTTFWTVLFPASQAVLRARDHIVAGGTDEEAADALLYRVGDLRVRVSYDEVFSADNYPTGPDRNGTDAEYDNEGSVMDTASVVSRRTSLDTSDQAVRTRARAWNETLTLALTGLTKVTRHYCLLPALADRTARTAPPVLFPVWRWVCHYLIACLERSLRPPGGSDMVRALLTAWQLLIAPVEIHDTDVLAIGCFWQCAWDTGLRLGHLLADVVPHVESLPTPDMAALPGVDPARLDDTLQAALRTDWPVLPAAPWPVLGSERDPATYAPDLLASYLNMLPDLLVFPTQRSVTRPFVLAQVTSHLRPLLRTLEAVALCPRSPLHQSDAHNLSPAQATAYDILVDVGGRLFSSEETSLTDPQRERALAALLSSCTVYLLAPFATLTAGPKTATVLPLTPTEREGEDALVPPEASLPATWARLTRWFADAQATPHTDRRAADRYRRRSYPPTYLALSVRVLSLVTDQLATHATTVLRPLAHSRSLLHILETFGALVTLGSRHDLLDPPVATLEESREAVSYLGPSHTQRVANHFLRVVVSLFPAILADPTAVPPTEIGRVWHLIWFVVQRFLFGSTANAPLVPTSDATAGSDSGDDDGKSALSTRPTVGQVGHRAPTSFDTPWLRRTMDTTLIFAAACPTLEASECTALVRVLQLGVQLTERLPALPLPSPPLLANRDSNDTPTGTLEPSPVDRELLAFTCAGYLFALSAAPAGETDPAAPGPHDLPCATPLSLAQTAGRALVDHCARLLTTYAHDRQMLGHCPLPRLREEELAFILERLACLNLRAGVDVAPGPALAARVGDTASVHRVQHLFVLYPHLCRAILYPDTRLLPLLHRCLARVGETWASPIEDAA